MKLILTVTPEQLRALHDILAGRIEDAECYGPEHPDDEDAKYFAGDLSLRPILEGLDAHAAGVQLPGSVVEVRR